MKQGTHKLHDQNTNDQNLSVDDTCQQQQNSNYDSENNMMAEV